MRLFTGGAAATHAVVPSSYCACRVRCFALRIFALRYAARWPSAERKEFFSHFPSAYPFSAQARLGPRWANLSSRLWRFISVAMIVSLALCDSKGRALIRVWISLLPYHCLLTLCGRDQACLDMRLRRTQRMGHPA